MKDNKTKDRNAEWETNGVDVDYWTYGVFDNEKRYNIKGSLKNSYIEIYEVDYE